MKIMIEKIMNRKTLVMVSIMLILLWGGISASNIQHDYLPSINNSTLMVTVRAQNYQADQVKAYIATPIEQAVRTVDGLQDIETTSSNGGLSVSLYFPLNTNMERAEGQVSQVLDAVALPNGVQKPAVTRLSTNAIPIMRLSLESSSEKIDENTLRTTVKEKVSNQLKTVPGVKDVRIFGGGNNGYAVTIHIKDLDKDGITLNDVKRSLEANFSTGMQGNISDSQVSVPIQVAGPGISEQDLMQLPIFSADGKSVPLSNVANISKTIVDAQTISRTNGKASVLLDILKTPSSNITEVADRINSRIKEIPEIKNKEIRCSILLDQGEQVHSSLNGLMKEGLLGCFFSMICVYCFFRKIRSTLLIALSLPICLLATIGILKTMGTSLNLLTVSGLIVAMGRVVDDSIVILDHIYRKGQGDGNRALSLNFLSQAVCEMLPAIASSTATTIAVFVPIAMIGGMVSAAFSGFAWSVVIALVISLLVSIFIVPTLFHLFWKGQPIKIKDPLESFTPKLFHWVFQRKLQMVSICIALFLMALAGAAYLPVNFLPTANQSGQIGVQVEMPEGTALTQIDAEVKRLEAWIRSNPKVDSFSSSLGSSFTPQADDIFDEGGGWLQKTNVANMSITVKQGIDVPVFTTELQNQLKALSSSAVYTVTNLRIAGDDSLLKLNITGSDNLTLAYAARTIRSKLQLVSGLAVQGLADNQEQATPYRITLNQNAIESNGIKINDILDRMGPYLAEGITVSLKTDQGPVPLVIHSDIQNIAAEANKGSAAGKASVQSILTLMGKESFKNKQGQNVSLNELAALAPNANPSVIQDKNGQPYAVVAANITSTDVGKVTSEVKAVLEGISLPQGVKITFAGATEQVNQMIYEMTIALSCSVLLVLFIISTVFRGWKPPLSVLICIPFAFIGSVIGMVSFGKEWNLASLVGLLMLTGIAVTNGIVLVDKIERNLAKGMIPKEAIFEGTLSRVRPVLMTAATTILTLLPLAVSPSGDSIISQTLGIVVVGGMISSTLISLVVIPIIYEWIYTAVRFRVKKKDAYLETIA
ncbi:efflux RND transporter permease subunit [Paenibacillus filicis]|uniref:Efflux RND transporter permease subunit n=1 Tax=Paenibacillus gyeongsangnamensis TaxID=3388067 RepID=A0ABT4QA69_9BACL|nr:efflux RND transporter permease subunit [Paenibacillus filicis]MCZ8513736.1 efflux RND transporter permease subunit [Paenibacillus filicis]